MAVVLGNRGKCAQGCRLPFNLLENDKTIDSGYLLSTKDLCSLELLPNLIKTNINSLKIEGRMKSPEYVATVTRIYRKYIDKIYNNEEYIVDLKDKEDLLQVFNRGGFSAGHLNNIPNKDLIYKEKPNNMGIYLGNVSNYNSNKGHITLNLNNSLNIGDSITFEKENTKYTVSELMENNKNINIGNTHQKVTIGRMKGNINIGDKLYKISSKSLSTVAKESYSKENIKQPISAILDIHLDEPLKLKIYDNKNNEVLAISNDIPQIAINAPITKERLESQLNKTSNTPFYFKNIKVNLDNNLFLPKISIINELRRNAIEQYTNLLISKYCKTISNTPDYIYKKENTLDFNNNKICLLLNTLNLDFNYSNIENIDKLYVPLKYFYLKEYENILKTLSNKFSLYIYLPSILKPNYRNIFRNIIDNSLTTYNIKGFVLSNIGNFDLLKDYQNNYEFIGNYTLNIFNNCSCNNLNLDSITISPELNKDEINEITTNCNTPCEFLVYGYVPVMTSSYCLLGKTNKCYPECTQKCKTNNKYYLKDRMNFYFRIIPDNIQTITTIFNSKINSIELSGLKISNYRIDILDETIEQINNIIKTVKDKKRIEGNNYTNGNINRLV